MTLEAYTILRIPQSRVQLLDYLQSTETATLARVNTYKTLFSGLLFEELYMLLQNSEKRAKTVYVVEIIIDLSGNMIVLFC